MAIGMIPARFGSTRFPGKPLAMIAGKSLIQRSYENAKKCLEEVVVVTDDVRIFEHVEGFGGRAMMSSDTCESGTDRLAEAVRDIECEIVVNLQGDWPCLEKHVIRAVIDVLGEDGMMGSAVIPMRDGIDSSRLVKCVMDRNHRALYFSRSPIPFGAENFYGHLGIYSYRKDFLLKLAELPATPLQKAESLEQLKVLEHGFPIELAIVETEVMSVDVPEDIQKVEDYLCGISSLQAESAPR